MDRRVTCRSATIPAMIRRLAAVLAVLSAVLVASCSTPPSQPAPSVTPTTQAASTPSSTTADRSAELCATMHSRILLLSSGFQLVEASRGQGDHETNVRNFSRDAKSVAGDTDDDNCANLVLPASALSMNAAIIQAAVVASGEASESDYREARKAGQELMDAAGITDTKFGEDMFGGK